MADQPNILLIMCDQLRYDWLGYAGASQVATPNIDRLASTGAVFTQATTNCPVCAPARIGLATGLRPHRMGALNNHSFLPLSRPTYYQRLRDHGYHVGCVGKLDLAKPESFNGTFGDRPWNYAWGFTHPHEVEGKMHAGRGKPPNGPYTAWLKEQGLLDPFVADYTERKKGDMSSLWPSVLPSEAFADSYVGRKACEMLEGFTGEFPWHFFVSFPGPHNPFDPPESYFDIYRDKDMPPPAPFQPDGKPSPYQDRSPDRLDPHTAHLARQLYSGYVTLLDDWIGSILDTLAQRDDADRTYICFASDHGEMLGDHAHYTKGVHYEGALRIPLVLSGPDIEPATYHDNVEFNDINATICDWAGTGPIPYTDGKSLCPRLNGETDEHRPHAVATHLGHYSIRTREWKLILNHQYPVELYHLASDPLEQYNIAEQNADIVADLERRLWLQLMEDKALR